MYSYYSTCFFANNIILQIIFWKSITKAVWVFNVFYQIILKNLLMGLRFLLIFLFFKYVSLIRSEDCRDLFWRGVGVFQKEHLKIFLQVSLMLETLHNYRSIVILVRNSKKYNRGLLLLTYTSTSLFKNVFLLHNWFYSNSKFITNIIL